jgi:hypothetical protein
MDAPTRHPCVDDAGYSKCGDDAMKARTLALVSLCVLLAVPAARAQMAVDIAKITCRQILFDRNFSPKSKSIALWLSGYFNAKRNNTVIDLGAFEQNVDRVEDYCRLNQDINLMDAVEKVLASAK